MEHSSTKAIGVMVGNDGTVLKFMCFPAPSLTSFWTSKIFYMCCLKLVDFCSVLSKNGL